MKLCVAVGALESGIPWLFTGLDTAKERLEGAVQARQHILQDLRMNVVGERGVSCACCTPLKFNRLVAIVSKGSMSRQLQTRGGIGVSDVQDFARALQRVSSTIAMSS